MTRYHEQKYYHNKWEQPLKTWEVTDKHGHCHIIRSHYRFDNGSEGLIFRTHIPGSDKTTIVAAFAHGGWDFYKEITNDGY